MYFIKIKDLKEYNKIKGILFYKKIKFNKILTGKYFIFLDIADAELVSKKYDKVIYILKEITSSTS